MRYLMLKKLFTLSHRMLKSPQRIPRMVSPGRQVRTVVLESDEPARRLVMQTQNQWSPGKKIPPIARRMLISNKDGAEPSRFRVEDLD